ncbi:MAG: undecaprenyl-diphosphate phosphatase [Candidatus Limivicinus sp.]
MDLNWLQSLLYGFLAGLTDILPVSAQAHQVLLLKFFGIQGNMEVMDLWIHLGIFGALYLSCQSQLIRFSRARALARVPKRKRKRPLDVRSLMDFSMLKTMLVPVILALFFYRYASGLRSNLMLVAVFLFLNGVILYIPQFLPTSNRDSRTLSRVEGLLMGLGGAVSIVPGFSAIGVSTAIGSVCGVERCYSLNMALLMNMVLTLGLLVYDVMGIAASGLGTLSFGIFFRYLLTALVAFGGTMLGIKLLRQLAENHSFALFALYCFGLSLFTFILNLMA